MSACVEQDTAVTPHCDGIAGLFERLQRLVLHAEADSITEEFVEPLREVSRALNHLAGRRFDRRSTVARTWSSSVTTARSVHDALVARSWPEGFTVVTKAWIKAGEIVTVRLRHNARHHTCRVVRCHEGRRASDATKPLGQYYLLLERLYSTVSTGDRE